MPPASERQQKRRRWIFLLVVLSAVETCGWAVDSVWEFRRRLLLGYRQQTVDRPVISRQERGTDKTTAIADARDDDDPRLFVRPRRDVPDIGQDLVIGGRVIPDARYTTSQVALSPDENTARHGKQVFLLGGSAAYGYPYNEGNTLAGELRNTLNQPTTPEDPARFQVHNTAFPGWNSHDLVPVARRIASSFQPEIIVIFTGNNEWVRWRPESCQRQAPVRDTPSTSRKTPGDRQRPPRDRTNVIAQRLLTHLAHSRALATAQYLAFRWQRRQLMTAASEAHLARFEATYRMHVELTGSGYALQHPADLARFDPSLWKLSKENYLDEFRHNLVEIVRTFRGCRVVLITVPFNYRLSPAWNHRQPLASDPKRQAPIRKALDTAIQQLAQSKPATALQTLQAASRDSCQSPLLHYIEGECLVRLGRMLEAESAFARCREQMVGHLGGRLSINRVIGSVAKETGCDLLDARALFDRKQHALDGFFNRDLIHDDCHPTPRGHRLLATALQRVLDPLVERP
ncbi:MAG: SGNH/GDSL hydrolase family protein [Planctomycetaceae bacterium]